MIFCLLYTNIFITSRFCDESQRLMSNVDTIKQEISELSIKYFQVVFTCSVLLSVKVISPQKFFFQSHQNIFCSVLTNEHFGVLIWSGMVLWEFLHWTETGLYFLYFMLTFFIDLNKRKIGLDKYNCVKYYN